MVYIDQLTMTEGETMRFADPLKKLFTIVAMFVLAMPLPVLAQDDKKPEEKKADEKEA